jgi:hypothetical protein
MTSILRQAEGRTKAPAAPGSMTTNANTNSGNTTTLQTRKQNPPSHRNASHHPINQQGLILRFNPLRDVRLPS